MNLFDKSIDNLLKLFDEYNIEVLDSSKSWESNDTEEYIFEQDTILDIGNGKAP